MIKSQIRSCPWGVLQREGYPEVYRWAILGVAYLLMSWSAWPEGGSIRHPAHHDDYHLLAFRWADLSLTTTRPLTYAAYAAVNSVAPSMAHVLHALLVTTSAWLAIRFVELFLFRGRQLPLLGVLSCAALAFGLPACVSYTAYLGLITNIFSATFGLTAMCFLAYAHLKQDRVWIPVLSSWACASLSLLSKEDFALPMLMTAAWLAYTDRRREFAWSVAALMCLPTAAFLHSRIGGSPFISGAAAPDLPYHLDASVKSVFNVALEYARASAYAPVLLLILLATAGIQTVNRESRFAALQLAVLAALGVAPIVPHLLLPNHVFAFYTFYPGMLIACALVCGIYGLHPERNPLTKRIDLVGIGMLLMACGFAGHAGAERHSVANWYSEQSAYNAKLTRFCAQNQPLLSGRDVAVYGVSGLSPWLKGSASYLYRRFGLDTRWHIVGSGPIDPTEKTASDGAWATLFHRPDTLPEVIRDPRTLHVLVEPDGSAAMASSLEEAMQASMTQPLVYHVIPRELSRKDCRDGCALIVIGKGLKAGIRLSVDGRQHELIVNRFGDVGTSMIGPLASEEGSEVAVELLVNDRTAWSGRLPVK